MDSEEQFHQLARRDTEITTLAARGRRRALGLMVLLSLPLPFVVMKLNNDITFAGVIPVFLGCLGGISYSWAKWRRRPEDAQSVAFVGLDRRRRSATYRSMWRGIAIEDPVVLTIVESIDHHLRLSFWSVVAAVVALAAAAITLIEIGGGGSSVGALVAASTIGALAAAVIGAHRWVMNRITVVLDRGRLH
jgi:hypothetical protein